MSQITLSTGKIFETESLHAAHFWQAGAVRAVQLRGVPRLDIFKEDTLLLHLDGQQRMDPIRGKEARKLAIDIEYAGFRVQRHLPL